MDNDLKKENEKLEIENRRLDAKVFELYTLYNISKRLSLATQIEEILNDSMDVISKSLQIDDFCILLLDDEREKLVVYASHGEADLKSITFNLGEGITGKVANEGTLKLIPDASKCEDFLFYKGKKKDIGSFLSIPLKGKDGKVVGVFNVHKMMPVSFTEIDIGFFKEVAEYLGAALYKAISFRKMEELSHKDPLTGLYNRRYLFDYLEKEIERAKRYKHDSSLILLDIDHFKNFNDTNGHLLGDGALKAVTKVLEDSTRNSDIVARFGGEEFIVLLPETDKTNALKVAEKIRKAIEDNKVDGEENQPDGRLTATFGVSAFGTDAVNAFEMIDCADKALYHGKTKGRNIVTPYFAE